MKPVKFKHCNVTFAENQPPYSPLPVLKLDTEGGEVIFCMGLSFWERIRVLFLGKIWVSLMMFGQDLTPSFHSTRRKDVYHHPDFEVNEFRRFIDLGVFIYFS